MEPITSQNPEVQDAAQRAELEALKTIIDGAYARHPEISFGQTVVEVTPSLFVEINRTGSYLLQLVNELDVEDGAPLRSQSLVIFNGETFEVKIAEVSVDIEGHGEASDVDMMGPRLLPFLRSIVQHAQSESEAAS